MKGVFKLFVFSLMPLLFLLAIGEVYCRVRLSYSMKDNFYLLSPLFENKYKARQEKKGEELKKASTFEYKISRFGTYYKLKSGIQDSATINSLGFRGNEFSPLKKKGTVRIFCIGESSTFGAGSPDDWTWPARLQFYLNKRQGGFEVINSAFSSYSSSDYISLIKNELINYSPDIFIVYAGVNNLRDFESTPIITNLTKIHNFLYYRWSMLYTLLSEKLCLILDNSPFPRTVNSINQTKAIDGYINDIENIINIGKNNKIRLIFVRQMLNNQKDLFADDILPLEMSREALRWRRIEHYADSALFYYQNEMMKRLKELCKKYNIEFIDPRGEFYDEIVDNNVDLFIDFVHLTPKGNDLLGRLISEKLF